ncbi:MAG: extracellular solute-binding protein [Gemmataceae bacterium]
MMYRQIAFLGLVLLSILLVGCGGKGEDRVVVYCALDREFSEVILEDFTKKTGIRVLPRFDTEATKSVGLFQELLREKSKPRCDVHWNNEILATVRLQKAGVLQPYDSPAAAPYPKAVRARDNTWCGFASRARILIVNTDKLKEADWPRSLADLTKSSLRGQVAMAKPEFGTTASHAACLFEVWGAKKAKEFYRALQKNDVKILGGNKDVAVAVGKGQYAVGMTDTDDAMGEVRAGKAVKILFPKSPEGSSETLFFPNTVALVRGCPNPEAGKKLIDYLLSKEVEEKLALSDSCQIPLHPEANVELPVALRGVAIKGVEVDFRRAAGRWSEVQTFLKSLFAR